jgi:flagellar hook protein FlgE
MAGLRVVDGFVQASRGLVVAGVLALAGCGGGGADHDELQAMASTAPGGQALPAGLGIQKTDQPLDVAIDGGGAFVLRDPRTGAHVLSRLGHFDIDAQGRLINAAGWLVLGVPAGETPSTLDALVPIPPIPHLAPPVATHNVKIEANLDARASILATDASGARLDVDFYDASTYNNATSVNVYDKHGTEAVLTLYFRKVAPDVWRVYSAANDITILPDGQGRPQPIAELTFPPNGTAPINPVDPLSPLPSVVIDVPVLPRNFQGVETSALRIALDLSMLTSYGAIFGVTNQTQDGWPPGQLNNVSVLATGELVIDYSNGKVDHGLRLALARTTLADRLYRYEDWGWICGQGCQPPVVAAPGQRLTGMLVRGALNTGS